MTEPQSPPFGPSEQFLAEPPASAWHDRYQAALEAIAAPRDRRLPGFLPNLPRIVCALRHNLEWLRISLSGDRSRLDRFLDDLPAAPSQDPAETARLSALIATALARGDWRERDLLDLTLEYLAALPERLPPELREELGALAELRVQQPEAHERTLFGLIAEVRGNLPGLIAAHRRLQAAPRRRALDADAVRELSAALARSFLGAGGAAFAAAAPTMPPEQAWLEFHRQANRDAAGDGLRLPLKLFEKASLYLLESLPLEQPGHASFVRYLIEDEAAYRRLLAGFYAPQGTRLARFQEEVERHNRLPEQAADPVHYEPDQARWFLQALYFRPDVVAAIVEREQQKDLYRVIGGLGARACLPRVLHEVRNIFGTITPEAFQKIVAILGLDPAEVIRVIASYKQYSVDPRGSILIYVCKGTACFLRGQPELSRRLSAEIRAEAGAVGRYGIQFIEMDCFGVCHLAPVVKTEARFLGRRRADDLPQILEELRKGPRFDNRLAFLERVLERLAPERHQRLPGDFTLSQVVVCTGDPVLDPLPPTAIGQPLRLEAGGVLVGAANGRCRKLGRLLENTLGFRYRTVQGEPRLGCLVLDRDGHIREALHFPEPWLKADLALSVRPTATVRDGFVWIQRPDQEIRLGQYSDDILALDRNGVRFLLVTAAASAGAPPPPARPIGSREATEREAFVLRQDRLVLGFAAGGQPEDLESYRGQGGYEAVHRVLGLRGEPAWDPAELVRMVTAAGLRGRGGAGFATGRKWEAMARAQCQIEDSDENRDAIKLIVANGDEGDPGAFMDRTLIQERPHQLIEGMILGAVAVGARYGIIYVRKEYEDAVRRLEHALFQARRKGYLGSAIFGVPGLNFDLEIRLGAGAFVAGEKRAILRAIEGKPAEPTLKAVSNTRRGLWGKPTLLNNVETFANVPLILRQGADWYRRQGTAHSGGSKIFSVAGIVRQTGLVEVRFGRTLADIIRICDGIQDAKVLAGVQIGGPSGAILSLTGVRGYLLDTPLDFDTFSQAGAMLGSGGLVFIGEDDDVVRLARHFTDWLADESCGQCPPCLRGTVSLGETLDAILLGQGTSAHIHALWAKSDSIKAGSRCGLGMTAANPVTSALRFFPHAFLHAVLGNPQLTAAECFATLEALRLLTRDDIVELRGGRRTVIGSSFVLKRPLVRHLATELERLDRHRPPHARRAERFLDLLGVPPREVGLRDLVLEIDTREAAPAERAVATLGG